MIVPIELSSNGLTFFINYGVIEEGVYIGVVFSVVRYSSLRNNKWIEIIRQVQIF